jgi:CxxC motif-containing protein (DUF1111 family)
MQHWLLARNSSAFIFSVMLSSDKPELSIVVLLNMTKNCIFACIFIVSMFACDKQGERPAIAIAEEGEELSGGENFTSYDPSENAFGEQGDNLTSVEETQFGTGNFLFRSNWVTAPASVQTLDGLGPIMNAISCGSCHFKDGRARPPAFATEELNGLLFRLSLPGTGPHGEPLDDPNYGGQLQDKSILAADYEGKVSVTYQEVAGQYADGTSYSLRKPVYEFYNLKFGALATQFQYSPRIAQQISGLGLLESVSEQTILAFADENDANGDGISGKPNYVWDEELQQTRLGRFGWKANQPSLRQQTAGAFNGDLGITSSIFPSEGLSTSQQALYSGFPNGGSPEISNENLAKIVLYVQTLSVPARRDWDKQEILRGKLLFQQANCSGCHIVKMQTASSNSVNALNNQNIRPYTDLLLHDMGDGLADGRPDFLANGNEWRTSPLWGLGMIKNVNKHTFLLHDGRARNIEEAILWHGGEAENAKIKFTKLSKNDRDALIKFLESL